jgi:peptide/nickel transport system ATP-binding protein
MTGVSSTIPRAPGAENTAAVSALRVEVAKSRTAVVEEVEFTLAPGEILGLVGESGSGKTTVGLALLGHSRRGLRIAGGSVRIAGEDILALSERALRTARGDLIAYVPQDPGTALNPALRIGTQLAECLRESEGRDSHLLHLLGEVKLPATAAFLRAFPHQMSGGQQQRVAIAMAFASRPKVIVMDEPTTGLDVTTQAHVLDTIRQLCARYRVAAVYVSHDLAVVASLANRVAVMYSGRIVELGPTAKVLVAPAHPYTRALIQAVPDLDAPGVLRGIPGQAPEPARRPSGCAFAQRCSQAIDSCRGAPPPPSNVGPDHMVRCILSDRSEAPRGTAAVQSMKPQQIGAALLQITDLRAFHGEIQILKGITLELPRQSCIALVGESGSGKTTLARCIAGLHLKLDGTMRFGDQALAAGSRYRPAEVRRQIQYIFQNPYASLNPRRSVGESIAAPLREFEPLTRQKLRQRVTAALDQVALPVAVADQYPHHLSGGQRQRAAIARALILEPALLICDEVTSSLDVSVQAVIVELLGKLQRERGLSMLFVTHNLPLVRSIAQQVAVMQGGCIVEFGPVGQVLSQPHAAETNRLLRDAPKFRTGRAA